MEQENSNQQTHYSFALFPFNHSSPLSSLQFDGNITLKEGRLRVTYQLKGPIDLINFGPEIEEQKRQDNLSKNSCFELFLKNKKFPDYLEFNFSAQLNWNCFYFSDYRQEKEDYLPFQQMPISFKKDKDEASLVTEVDSSLLPPSFWSQKKMRVGISAILYTKENQVTYWALKHLKRKADFHDPDSFVLKLH